MSGKTAASTGQAFRPDINGLRAWAVVAVVLYHFGVPGITGGFVGVDVFFVISGFLMAGIIVRGLERRSFSLWQFYLARARRIIPALAVLVAVVLLVGWFILMPREYQTLGGHARESLLFTSNQRYLSEAGYFDSASHEKWLLHTWSLSVEWQFYLVLPLVLLLAWKLRPARTSQVAVHLLILLGSLLACLVLTRSDPVKAFYILPTRAWELLAGGLVFFCVNRIDLGVRGRRLLEGAGLALIILAIVLFDMSSVWPGWRAAVPVLGGCLVILAQRESSLFTGSPVAQWLGERSYSIYLWHWPLVVGLVYLERAGDPLWIAGGLLVTVLLGHMSFRWVERPSQRYLSRCSTRRALTSLIILLLIVIVAAQVVRRNGVPSRLPEAIASIEAERQNRNPRQDECLSADSSCIYGGEKVEAILLGDSYADAVVTAFQAAVPALGMGIYFKGESACLIVFGARSQRGVEDACSRLREQLKASLATTWPDKPVVIVNRTSFYAFGGVAGDTDQPPGRPLVDFSTHYATPEPAFLAEFRQEYLATACAIAATRPLYLVRPIPEMHESVPNAMGRALLLGKEKIIAVSRADYEQRNQFIWQLQDEASKQCGVRILDPLPYLCDEKFCYGSKSGRPLYADGTHLSEHGNRLLVPMFEKVFQANASEAVLPAEPAVHQ